MPNKNIEQASTQETAPDDQSTYDDSKETSKRGKRKAGTISGTTTVTPAKKKVKISEKQNPTPAKSAAEIDSDRTAGALGSSQGDHIIANTLIKSFLLSVDSIQDETSFSNQASVFIRKTQELLRVAGINYDDDVSFADEINKLLNHRISS